MLVKKRSSRFRYIKIVFISLFLIAGALSLFNYSSFFDIKGVFIDGEDIVHEEILSTSPIGKSIFFWQPELKESYKYKFSDVQIRRDYLNRKLIVKLQERDKYIIWCFEVKSECLWVDKTGFAFGDAPRSSGFLVKRLSDYREGISEGLGGYVLPEDFFGKFSDAMTLIDRLKLSVSALELKEFDLKEIVASIENGPQIVFSLLVDPTFSIPTLKSLMDSDDWTKIVKINLTVDERVYYNY